MQRLYGFDNKLPWIIIPATIAGGYQKKTIRLALDTGASNVVIPYEVALNVGCSPSKSHEWVKITVGGNEDLAPKVIVPYFECLGFRLRHFAVVCHNLSESTPIDGLLGVTFLRRFEIKINYPHGYLIISDEIKKSRKRS